MLMFRYLVTKAASIVCSPAAREAATPLQIVHGLRTLFHLLLVVAHGPWRLRRRKGSPLASYLPCHARKMNIVSHSKFIEAIIATRAGSGRAGVISARHCPPTTATGAFRVGSGITYLLNNERHSRCPGLGHPSAVPVLQWSRAPRVKETGRVGATTATLYLLLVHFFWFILQAYRTTSPIHPSRR